MKIPVENNIDEIVAELERLGFTYDEDGSGVHGVSAIGTWTHDMTYCTYCSMYSIDEFEETTIAELKEM